MSRSLLSTALLLLVVTAAFLWPLERLGLSDAAGESLWIVRDSIEWDAAPGDLPGLLRQDVESWWGRVQDSTGPPLYSALLDGWEVAAGESPLALRWPSLLCALAAAVTVAALVRHVAQGIAPALIVLPAFLALTLPVHSIAPYALNALLASLATWVLLRKRGVLVYGLLLVVAFYVDYAALLLVPAHLPVILGMPRRRIWTTVTALALLTLVPWLLLVGPDDIAQAVNIGSVLSVVGVPVAFTVTWLVLRTSGRLTVAYGAFVLLAASAFALGTAGLGARVDWPDAVSTVNAERAPTEPMVYIVDERHPLKHYNRLDSTHWRRGITVNLGWHDLTSDRLQSVVERLGDGTVWALLPADDPVTALILDVLTLERELIREIRAGEMVLYRLPPAGALIAGRME